MNLRTGLSRPGRGDCGHSWMLIRRVLTLKYVVGDCEMWHGRPVSEKDTMLGWLWVQRGLGAPGNTKVDRFPCPPDLCFTGYMTLGRFIFLGQFWYLWGREKKTLLHNIVWRIKSDSALKTQCTCQVLSKTSLLCLLSVPQSCHDNPVVISWNPRGWCRQGWKDRSRMRTAQSFRTLWLAGSNPGPQMTLTDIS